MSERKSDWLDRTFLDAERAGLKVAMQGRLAVLAVVALWFGLTRPFPHSLTVPAAILAFMLIGLVQWLLIATGRDRPSHNYAFATADLSLVNPGLHPVMLFRFDVFSLLLPVAAAAFAYSPALVAWTGVTIAAARLEAMNKEHGTSLLVSDSVVAAAGDGFAFRSVGEVNVRGKSRPVTLFTLDR